MADLDFHLDHEIRVNHQRHAGIVLRDTNILLMHRIYKGREFYVIPGGHIQKGEDPLLVAIREIEEETSVIVKDPKLVFEFKNYYKDNHDFYYICDYVSGEPELGGEEKIKNSEENFFEPMWLPLEQVPEINLLPKFAREWIVETLIEKR